MVREVTYDDVFDAQQHFRVLLDVMARPGKIATFPAVAVTPPTGLETGAAYVALALVDSNASYHLTEASHEISTYLRMNTGSTEAQLGAADFIFAPAHASPEVWLEAKKGSLPYPETGATIVLQTERLSREAFAHGTRLELEGPGIASRQQITIAGLTAPAVESWQEANAEFPLGVDVMVVAPGLNGAMICTAIPRTTKLKLLSPAA